MYEKLKIVGEIQVLTGLHIGGSSEFAAIGAVNSPVIRDAKTQLPILPGSSIKGKLRSLLVRRMATTLQDISTNPDNDPEKITRLFGKSAKKNSETNTEKKMPVSRLQFSDCFLKNKDELFEFGMTEVKGENVITRITGEAMPRTIERVVPGAIFGLECVYDIYADTEINRDEVIDDFKNLTEALCLLQLDYLGGNGTRGYGRIRFRKLHVQSFRDLKDPNLINDLEKILRTVEEGGNYFQTNI